jgi:hypothetical protein
MRKLVRGGTKEEVRRKLNKLPKDWRPISGIHEDPSGIAYGNISYVCVIEAEDLPQSKNRHWGKF